MAVYSAPNSSSLGFTLIELAIVLVVAGLLSAAAVQTYDLYKKDELAKKTERSMARTDEAINKYFAKYGRFPCPSDPAKMNYMRGREWGRLRQTTAKYDSDNDGDIDVSDASYSDDATWKDGKGGPVSDVYCKGSNPDKANCIKAGKASICNIQTTAFDTKDKWPTPALDDLDGAHNCGANTFIGNNDPNPPSQLVCVVTGDKPDDTVDMDWPLDGVDAGDANLKDNGDISPPGPGGPENRPENISCIKLVVGSDPAKCTDVKYLRIDDVAAGGDGYDSIESGDEDGLDLGEKVKLLLVLSGGIPFADLGLPETDTLDGYGNPLRYAVTLGLTRKGDPGNPPTIPSTVIDLGQTGILLATQKPGTNSVYNNSDVNAEENKDKWQKGAQYLLLSYGKNATQQDFYDNQIGDLSSLAPVAVINGIKAPAARCRAATAGGGDWVDRTTGTESEGDRYIENENCDNDADYIISTGKSVNWNGSGDVNRSYFDDDVITNLSSSSDNLWMMSKDTVYNKNAGNVGIGTNDPNSKLHVYPDILVEDNLSMGRDPEEQKLCPSGVDSNGDGSEDCGDDGLPVDSLMNGEECSSGSGIAVSVVNGDVVCKENVELILQTTCPNRYYINGYDASQGKYKCIRPSTNDCQMCNGGGCQPC